jgi:hypothetical protein
MGKRVGVGATQNSTVAAAQIITNLFIINLNHLKVKPAKNF